MTQPLTVPIAVDVVALTVIDHTLHALVVHRGIEPFKDHLALPGGFLREGEQTEEAAARELEEETGITPPDTSNSCAPTGRRDVTPRAGPLRRLPPPHPIFAPTHAGGDARELSGTPSTHSSPPTHPSPSTTRASSRTESNAPAPRSNTPPGHVLLRPRIHDHTAAHDVRGHLGFGARPAQLPPQSNKDGLLHRADGRHRARGGRSPGCPLPPRPRC